jgi:hypothetical protein
MMPLPLLATAPPPPSMSLLTPLTLSLLLSPPLPPLP